MTPRISFSEKGRRRLKILLGLLGGGTCAIFLALAVVVLGAPYNPFWWLVMAVILVASFVLPSFLVRPIEWLVKGHATLFAAIVLGFIAILTYLVWRIQQ